MRRLPRRCSELESRMPEAVATARQLLETSGFVGESGVWLRFASLS